jgi:hypothetical protein
MENVTNLDELKERAKLLADIKELEENSEWTGIEELRERAALLANIKEHEENPEWTVLRSSENGPSCLPVSKTPKKARTGLIFKSSAKGRSCSVASRRLSWAKPNNCGSVVVAVVDDEFIVDDERRPRPPLVRAAKSRQGRSRPAPNRGIRPPAAPLRGGILHARICARRSCKAPSNRCGRK